MGETLRRTTLGSFRPGRRVNLERPLRVGDRLDGHWVNGHVDGRGRILEVRREGRDVSFRIGLPAGLGRFVVEKGSIAVDGVSLTVGEVDAGSFRVYIIPETRELTLFGTYRAGDEVNIEADILAKYAAKALAADAESAGAAGGASGARGAPRGRWGRRRARSSRRGNGGIVDNIRMTRERRSDRSPKPVARGIRGRRSSRWPRPKRRSRRSGQGRFVIVVDDEERENEGDLICAAEAATPELVNFMARFGRGLICVPMEEERLVELDLQADGPGEHRQAGHAVHRLGRRPRGDDDRDLGPRPRGHDPGAHPAGDAAGGSGPARSHLPPHGAQGRRPATRGAHRGGGRPGAPGRSLSGGRALRDPERRRDDGPAAPAPRVRRAARHPGGLASPS